MPDRPPAPAPEGPSAGVLLLAFGLGMGAVLWWRLGDPRGCAAPTAPEAADQAQAQPGPGAPDGPLRCDLPPDSGGAGALTGRFGGRQLISVAVPLHGGVLDVDSRSLAGAGPERRWTDAQADTVLRLAGFTAGNAWLELRDGGVLALAIGADGGCVVAGRAEVAPPAVELRCPFSGSGPLPLVGMVVTRPQPAGTERWVLAPVQLRIDPAARALVVQGPETFSGTAWFSWDARTGPEAPVGLDLSWDAGGCAPVVLPGAAP